MEETTPKLVSYMSENINEISAALSAFQGSVEQPKLEKEVKVRPRPAVPTHSSTQTSARV